MKRILIVLIALSIGAGTLYAHHGRGATYDGTKEVQVKGTVKQVLWRNPHIGILIDVKDAAGKVTTWSIEHSNVSTLARLGYTRLSLQAGWEVTAERNPSTAARANPRQLFAHPRCTSGAHQRHSVSYSAAERRTGRAQAL